MSQYKTKGRTKDKNEPEFLYFIQNWPWDDKNCLAFLRFPLPGYVAWHFKESWMAVTRFLPLVSSASTLCPILSIKPSTSQYSTIQAPFLHFWLLLIYFYYNTLKPLIFLKFWLLFLILMFFVVIVIVVLMLILLFIIVFIFCVFYQYLHYFLSKSLTIVTWTAFFSSSSLRLRKCLAAIERAVPFPLTARLPIALRIQKSEIPESLT